MSYISQEKKKVLEPAIKAVLKKYGMKGSVGIQHHSKLVVNVSSGAIDFTGERGYIQVNTYWNFDQYEGDAKNFLTELLAAMKGDDWYDNSDPQSDYSNIAYYLSINIGKWDKPYVFTGKSVENCA